MVSPFNRDSFILICILEGSGNFAAQYEVIFREDRNVINGKLNYIFNILLFTN